MKGMRHMLDKISPKTYAEQQITFENDGFASFPGLVDNYECRKLVNSAQNSRQLEKIFLSEEEFNKQTFFSRTGPRPGRNLAEKLDTDFIFGSKEFSIIMENVLGLKYRIYDYKFVCGVPTSCLPNWIKDKINDRLVNNLGMYVKPEYRDVTYFHGIDFHQDIIDYPFREADFITAYIYLDTVTSTQAPLHVLPGSQEFGCTEFPHKLKMSKNQYGYQDGIGNTKNCDCVVLTGEAGDMSIWHSAVLHGTQPQANDSSRMSLRILVERNGDSVEGTWLDSCNSKIIGNLSLAKTRNDIDSMGLPTKSGNIINKKN